MDRAKILDKIQKCLNLGKSPNEHEAAAAMRQAQKLMERHGVTEGEIGLVGYGKETVQTAIQAGKKVPLGLAAITSLIMRAFGVKAVFSRVLLKTDYNFAVTYYGPEHRVMLAKYAHEVVARSVEGAWQKHLKENPHFKGLHGARAGFYLGWVHGVDDKLMDFGMNDEEKERTKLLIESEHTNLSKPKENGQKVMGSTLKAGSKASEGFSLHRPVNGAERLKIGN